MQKYFLWTDAYNIKQNKNKQEQNKRMESHPLSDIDFRVVKVGLLCPTGWIVSDCDLPMIRSASDIFRLLIMKSCLWWLVSSSVFPSRLRLRQHLSPLGRAAGSAGVAVGAAARAGRELLAPAAPRRPPACLLLLTHTQTPTQSHTHIHIIQSNQASRWVEAVIF